MCNLSRIQGNYCSLYFPVYLGAKLEDREAMGSVRNEEEVDTSFNASGMATIEQILASLKNEQRERAARASLTNSYAYDAQTVDPAARNELVSQGYQRCHAMFHFPILVNPLHILYNEPNPRVTDGTELYLPHPISPAQNGLQHCGLANSGICWPECLLWGRNIHRILFVVIEENSIPLLALQEAIGEELVWVEKLKPWVSHLKEADPGYSEMSVVVREYRGRLKVTAADYRYHVSPPDPFEFDETPWEPPQCDIASYRQITSVMFWDLTLLQTGVETEMSQV
ncbi:uncharacterized protein BDR25DRAFT_347839 [Lindgomyces ingoldianus]|uniref:Uncharacterized protein n=1 Tax=Lindgomyces ingoldianus TaxID=673940 RepID=A0ACB6REC3_9PLEO|nr:uncharacterized protein BDR25DRAFT_347839 [Lindgomyces ingoldianus]KAF2477491.1 hypothetical protein BDR25DRAFT_347839 [Lindgomyces ingoldianus]